MKLAKMSAAGGLRSHLQPFTAVWMQALIRRKKSEARERSYTPSGAPTTNAPKSARLQRNRTIEYIEAARKDFATC
jgi:hypothetical protein